ncbi:MAG TPA: hypothetical protein ENK18_06285 [Deltaproteobacteria bacterium]|nr:hypothetical protein [Deltaproteobacteria bacterium]
MGYARTLEPLLSERCGGCHLGGFASGGFSFDTVPDELVGVSSRASMPYVTAGAPEESYLLHKLAGTHLEVGGFGARMPIGPPLTESEISLVRSWIQAGALP